MKPIRLVLQPSYTLTALLIGMVVLSFLSISFAPIALLAKLTLGLLIVFTTIYFVARDALRLLPKSWQEIEVNDKGELTISNSIGERFNARVKTNSYVTLHLVILHVVALEQVKNSLPMSNLKPFNNNRLRPLIAILNPRQMVILQDSASQAEFRQLCVWLRWWQHSHTGNHADAEF